MPRRASARSSPRTWSRSGVDYSQFVTVDDAAPKAVDAGGRQICVEGLEHGGNYNITFRPGLPAAIGEVLEAPVDARHLHPGSRAFGPLHRRQLRAAGDRPPRHSGRDRQSRRGRHQALPHRRPFAGAASVRLSVPAPARRLRRQLDRRPDGRAGLGGQARHRQRPQQGSDDQLPDRRGAAGPQARRLCAHRAAGERQERRLAVARHAVVRRLRHRPHHLHRRGRAQRVCPLAGDRQAAGRRRPDAACPQQ